jgi:hypothetical protein
VNAFLGELGVKLVDRWLTLLVLPGLLYVVVATVATVLGQAHATDLGAWRTWTDTITGERSGSGLAMAVAGMLTAAVGAALMAAALGQLAQRVWTTPGRRAPARWLTVWRRRRWQLAYEEFCAAVRAGTPAALASAANPAPGADSSAAMRRCTRICLVPADRPTWIGDRLRAADERIHRTYRLDLSAAWPRLWIVIPETTRTELGAAQNRFTAAARLSGWALLYLILGPVWWPALIIAAVTAATASIQARMSTAVLADLIEATVDLYGPELARQLGIACAATLTPEVGQQISQTLRKDDTLHPDR